MFIFVVISLTGHNTGSISSPSTPSPGTPSSYREPAAVNQPKIAIASPSTPSPPTPSSYNEPAAINQPKIANQNTTKQDVLPSCEPSTIDQALCQTTFSTFGVTDRPTLADDHDGDDYENTSYHLLNQHRTVENSDSLNKDGLEDSHSSFSTFSVPANRYL